jgi:Protein of unknown function (DUF3617)
MRRILLSAALLLLPLQAHAAGKEGLWSVTTIWQFSMDKVPPAIVALARQQGLKPPVNGHPFIHHICMTSYEVDGSQPLHLNSRDLDCSFRTVSMRRGVMATESICHGPVEGVTKGQFTWRGNTHFEGSTDFRGKYRGDPARMSSTISADFVGDDCRGVRPYVAQNN